MILARLLACLSLLLLPLPGSVVQAAHIRANLEAETPTPAPGGGTTLALRMTPEKDWHGYWLNPGDAGAPVSIDWMLPPGVKVGPLRYPVPQRLIVAGLMNYVYERPYALLMPVSIAKSVAPGTRLRLTGRARWLACSPSICVPERAQVAIELIAGRGVVDRVERARFDGWRAALPLPLGQPATFEARAGKIRIAIALPEARAADARYFYPVTEDVIAYAAPQTISGNGDRLIIEVPAASPMARAERIQGVLAIGEDRGLSIVARPGPVPAAGVPLAASEGGKADWQVRTFLIALGGAIAGGLLLNVMPCVFPILSLKALSLARSGETNRQARTEAIAYSAGIVLSCIALALLLLGLRAGGASAGWGFQLQDPRMVMLLLLLVTTISLNLAGLFELRSIGLGEAMTQGHGAAPAFWTGVLAALVATPCSGPFMAGAVGVALLLPAGLAVAVFAGLGLGLALPFLILGFVPVLRRRLPRPGAWMERVRRLLSLPMFATAIALAWLLGRQAGRDWMAAGIGGALVLGAALWWVGVRQRRGRAMSWIPVLPALAAVLGLAALTPAGGSSATAEARRPAGTEPFSEARLADLLARRRPVFLYFTADWCLTCKVNERGAIEREAVREAFAKAGVTVMVGDWTEGDPAIGRFLESKGRSGVPLYLFYHRDGRVETLPQLLTPSMLTGLAG